MSSTTPKAKTPAAKPTPKIMTATGEAFDFATADARATLQAQKQIEFIDDVRKHPGQWYCTEPGAEYWLTMQREGWNFYRCGVKGDELAEARAWRLRQMGWQDVPITIRMRGFERNMNYIVLGGNKRVRALMLHERNKKAGLLNKRVNQALGGMEAAGEAMGVRTNARHMTETVGGGDVHAALAELRREVTS
jgi:hypothetical protein